MTILRNTDGVDARPDVNLVVLDEPEEVLGSERDSTSTRAWPSTRRGVVGVSTSLERTDGAWTITHRQMGSGESR